MRISDWSSDVCSSDLTLYLMPQSDISGLPPGARVIPLEPSIQNQVPLPLRSSDEIGPPPVLSRHLPVGDALLGRVLDGAGRPLDDLGPLGEVSSAPQIGRASCRERVCPYG